MTRRFYTGVGSREAPSDALDDAEEIGFRLAALGFLVRSGAAGGMDERFEKGAHAWELTSGQISREIHIPWKGFRRNEHFDPQHQSIISDQGVDLNCTFLKLSGIATYVDNIRSAFRYLYARNVYQVIGSVWIEQYPPISEFLVYWAPVTRTGNVKGGTRIAVEVAHYFNVPTYNLGVSEERTAFFKRLDVLEAS